VLARGGQGRAGGRRGGGGAEPRARRGRATCLRRSRPPKPPDATVSLGWFRQRDSVRRMGCRAWEDTLIYSPHQLGLPCGIQSRRHRFQPLYEFGAKDVRRLRPLISVLLILCGAPTARLRSPGTVQDLGTPGRTCRLLSPHARLHSPVLSPPVRSAVIIGLVPYENSCRTGDWRNPGAARLASNRSPSSPAPTLPCHASAQRATVQLQHELRFPAHSSGSGWPP